MWLLRTYFLSIFCHVFRRGKEKHPCGLVELDLLICFLYTACNLISTKKTTQFAFGENRDIQNRLSPTFDYCKDNKQSQPLPNSVQESVNEEGVAFSRDVSFGKENFVVTALHQVLNKAARKHKLYRNFRCTK